MVRIAVHDILLSIKMNKARFVLPIFFAILISTIFAQVVLVAEPIHGSTFLFEGIDEVFVALNILVITLLSITSLFLFFRIFKKKRILAIKILVAVFILGGVLSTLLFGKLLFDMIGLASPLSLLVVALVTYVGAYFAYLVLVDALSNKTKNLLFVICSSALGSFLGVLVPPILALGISLFLSALDLILIERNIVENIVGEETYENLLTKVTFSHREWGVGIGDLTCYSMVVSNTSVNFGVTMGTLSLILVLIGVLLTLALASRRIRLPGLPIAITLGMLPSILLIILSY